MVEVAIDLNRERFIRKSVACLRQQSYGLSTKKLEDELDELLLSFGVMSVDDQWELNNEIFQRFKG